MRAYKLGLEKSLIKQRHEYFKARNELKKMIKKSNLMYKEKRQNKVKYILIDVLMDKKRTEKNKIENNIDRLENRIEFYDCE